MRIIAVSQAADAAKVASLKKLATVIMAGDERVDLTALLDELGQMGIQRLMVEGGGTLIAGLISAGLVDEIYTFIGNIIIGGKDAPTLADGPGFVKEAEFCRLSLVDVQKMEEGILVHWHVRHTK